MNRCVLYTLYYTGRFVLCDIHMWEALVSHCELRRFNECRFGNASLGISSGQNVERLRFQISNAYCVTERRYVYVMLCVCYVMLRVCYNKC